MGSEQVFLSDGSDAGTSVSPSADVDPDNGLPPLPLGSGHRGLPSTTQSQCKNVSRVLSLKVSLAAGWLFGFIYQLHRF